MKKLKNLKILNSKQQKIVQGGIIPPLTGTPVEISGDRTHSNNPFGFECYCDGIYAGRTNNIEMCAWRCSI